MLFRAIAVFDKNIFPLDTRFSCSVVTRFVIASLNVRELIIKVIKRTTPTVSVINLRKRTTNLDSMDTKLLFFSATQTSYQ